MNNPRLLPKAKRLAIACAVGDYGLLACREAYRLNVEQGEGGTVIEIETGIPKRRHGSAILVGEIAKNHPDYFTKAA